MQHSQQAVGYIQPQHLSAAQGWQNKLCVASETDRQEAPLIVDSGNEGTADSHFFLFYYQVF